jgi:hypothetical protein
MPYIQLVILILILGQLVRIGNILIMSHNEQMKSFRAIAQLLSKEKR